jgi:isoleucyl-tRNA synthetase
LIEFSGDEKISAAISKYTEYIAGETLANSITQAESGTAVEFEIEGQNLKLTIIRA